MAAPRAPYACDPDRSRGRLFAEPPSKTRSPFRRDCDRIIHSTAFRRLKHKTQVFVFHEGDHYRTRLTHSLEVAQIARALARQLGLDEDLTETLALAHDLGHPPFGHAGERALDACLQAYGGFDHNAQTLRVVTALEHRYPEFDGLNLTWESLEGIVKHNGPLTDAERGRRPGAISEQRHSASASPISTATTIWSSGASPRWRRRSRPSPTTSPMTPTTSTTACAPACSRRRPQGDAADRRTSSPRSHGTIPTSTTPGAARNWCAN